ncbi:hypothetical protein IJ182_08375 [bacterium]|nr:hypothetical protein [bacterium]
MKKIISTFLLLNFIVLQAFSAEFDTSIDADIRKNYDVESSSLPPLPKTVPTATVTEIPKTSYNATGKTYVIKHGTKVILSSKSTISDWSARGSKVSFVAQNGFTTKEGAIVPSGTLFKGTIVNSHPPQITGNGGLVELKIDEIYYNGVLSNIETKLGIANSKKVFFSDIKGERRYWKNFSKAMTPGKKTFDATRTCASVMAPIPVVNILSIIPLLGGSVVYVVNLVAAPVVAIFTKGGHLSLPAGTQFQIKFTNDTEIRG